MQILNEWRGVDSPPVLSATEARQGVTGHNVRYVLAAGIAGVVVLFILGYLGVRAFFPM
jgi:hypothetical protein